MKPIIVLVVAAGWLVACGDKIDAVQETCTSGQTATYQQEIKPILDTLCTGCHSSQLSGAARNGAPVTVDLDTFQAASKTAEQSNVRLQNETMPPSGTVASAAQKETFSCWLVSGRQEGP